VDVKAFCSLRLDGVERRDVSTCDSPSSVTDVAESSVSVAARPRALLRRSNPGAALLPRATGSSGLPGRATWTLQGDARPTRSPAESCRVAV